jgi:hypothetical protein
MYFDPSRCESLVELVDDVDNDVYDDDDDDDGMVVVQTNFDGLQWFEQNKSMLRYE